MTTNLATLAFRALFGFQAQLPEPEVVCAMPRLAEPDVYLLMGL